MHIQDFEAALHAEGYSPALQMERPAGYSLGEHAHPFDAWALITAGDITLMVEGAARTYAPGETFRLSRNTSHHESAGPHGVAYLSGRREAPVA